MLSAHILSLSFLPLLRVVTAQSATSSALEPLSSKHFTWPNIPFQVTGDNGGQRGPQAGYNLCNSTTENQNSLCQTSFVNDITDFCMWSSGQPSDTVGESEAREFAWCTKSGHGTRIIPPGAITGAQFLYAKSYIQVVGFIDQTQVNLAADDEGGELDPHGDDEQGNPLGGIEFTNAFGQSASSFNSALSSKSLGTTNYTQIIEWVDFIGSGVFCLKMCNPALNNGPSICAHVYDEIGCNFNALADYGAINNSFTVCDSDDMTPPGVFTDPASGKLTTWFQPFTGTFSVPYTTTIPSSSNCQTYSSAQLFAAATGTAATTGSAATGTAGSGGSSGTKTGTTAGASNTGAAIPNVRPSSVFAVGIVVALGAYASW